MAAIIETTRGSLVFTDKIWAIVLWDQEGAVQAIALCEGGGEIVIAEDFKEPEAAGKFMNLLKGEICSLPEDVVSASALFEESKEAADDVD